VRSASRALVLAALLGPARAAALVVVGELEAPIANSAVAVVDGIAYVASRSDASAELPPPGSLRIVDVSEPGRPAELGSLRPFREPRAIEAAGDVAYLADVADGLHLIDVSDPARPVERARILEQAWDVEVVGSLVYVASGADGLHVVDVSDPAAPQEIGSCAGSALLVEVEDDLAFVAGFFRLHVLDVSDPASPVELGSVEIGSVAQALAVGGGRAWIAEGAFTSFLRAVDVSDPAAPVGLGVSEQPDAVRDLELAGDLAWLATAQGLRGLDVSDPAAPVPLGFLSVGDSAGGVAVEAGLAYLAAGGLLVIDLAQPAFPAQLGELGDLGAIWDVEVRRGVAYVARNEIRNGFLRGAWLSVVDASEPAAPGELGRVAVPGLASAVELEGALAYVPSPRGVHVIDVSEPSAPAVRGTLRSLQAGFAFEVLGGTARFEGPGVVFAGIGEPFAIGGIGFAVADLRTGRIPRRKGPALGARWVAGGIDVLGDLTWVADSSFGLRAVDTLPGRAPRERGSLVLEDVRDVEVADGVAYAISNTQACVFCFVAGTLHVVDVSIPGAPRRLAALELPGALGEVEVADDLVYVSLAPMFSSSSSVLAVDVSDPRRPVTVGGTGVPGRVTALVAAGGLVYVGGASLRILDFGPEYRPPVVPAAIDVKPGDATNALDLYGNGTLRVAIRGGAGLDVRAVDRGSLHFGPGGALASGVSLKDADRDGAADLVARFPIRHTGLGPGDVEACLEGRLLEGTRISGCDAVRTPTP
jgi:hypothetical protein